MTKWATKSNIPRHGNRQNVLVEIPPLHPSPAFWGCRWYGGWYNRGCSVFDRCGRSA